MTTSGARPPSKRIKIKKKRMAGRPPIELLEEVFHLLRLAPAGVLAIYFLGTLPFLLGMLFFWADMSRSAFAYRHMAPASLGLAFLFLWMKYWQAVFCLRINDLILHRRFRRPGWRAGFRVAAVQSLVHSTGLFLLPLALITAFPFAWVYAFYQNATVLAFQTDTGFRSLYRKAWDQAKLWPWENHALLFILFLFGFFVFINVAAAIITGPYLLKKLAGVDSIFTLSGLYVLNTTFLAVTMSMTYMFLDPVVKTMYVIRCFHGASIKTGEDLKVELAEIRAVKPVLTLSLVFLLMLGLGAADVRADDRVLTETVLEDPSDLESGRLGLTPPTLDQSIKQVMGRSEYAWRFPREKPPADRDPGIMEEFLDWLADITKSAIQALADGLKSIRRWWDSLFPDPSPSMNDGKSRGFNWAGSVRFILYAGLGLLFIVLALTLYRSWRARGERVVNAVAAIPDIPDLEDESVGAEDLPGDGWLKLAREMREKGEYRLALRALYLATLARLAQRNILSLAKYKTNREYKRELDRRALERPEISTLFNDNLMVFERVWYGGYRVEIKDLALFEGKQERIIIQVDEEFGGASIPAAG